MLRNYTYYQDNGIGVLDEEEREKLFAIRGYVAKTAAEMATRILTNYLVVIQYYKSDRIQKGLFVILLLSLRIQHILYEDAMAGYGKSILGFKGHPTW